MTTALESARLAAIGSGVVQHSSGCKNSGLRGVCCCGYAARVEKLARQFVEFAQEYLYAREVPSELANGRAGLRHYQEDGQDG